MVWFTQQALDTMSERITQLGLATCPVCGSDQLGLMRWPGVLHVGGHRERGDPRDSSENILFMAIVECQLCGHVLLFDSEKFHGGDERILQPGEPVE